MGQKLSLVVEAEIEAPVETVRSLFKDFPSYKEWSSWSIESAVSSQKIDGLSPNDKLKVDVKDLKFTATLLKNDTDAFEWEGGVWPLLRGEHEFSWRPSTKTPGGTTFRQRENWRGLIVFLWRPDWTIGKNTRRNFEAFNAEVKKEAERRAAA